MHEREAKVAAETQEKGNQGKEREREGGKIADKVTDRMNEAVAPHLSAQTEEYIRVPLSRVDKLLYLVGEVVINKMKISTISAQAKRLSKLSKEMQKSIFEFK